MNFINNVRKTQWKFHNTNLFRLECGRIIEERSKFNRSPRH